MTDKLTNLVDRLRSGTASYKDLADAAGEIERLRNFIEKHCVGTTAIADTERWRIIHEWRKNAAVHEPCTCKSKVDEDCPVCQAFMREFGDTWSARHKGFTEVHMYPPPAVEPRPQAGGALECTCKGKLDDDCPSCQALAKAMGIEPRAQLQHVCLVAGCDKPAVVMDDGAVGGLCREHSDNCGLTTGD